MLQTAKYLLFQKFPMFCPRLPPVDPFPLVPLAAPLDLDRDLDLELDLDFAGAPLPLPGEGDFPLDMLTSVRALMPLCPLLGDLPLDLAELCGGMGGPDAGG